MRLKISLLLLMCLSFNIALIQSKQTAFWIDEALSIKMSGGAYFAPITPQQVISNVAEDNTWPPLSNLLLAMWGALVGWSEFAGRYLSALVGVLSVACMYGLGREVAHYNQRGNAPRMGFTSAVLLATSAFFVYYWHEMRGYTLYVLFTITSAWFYLRLLRPSVRTSPWDYGWFTLSLVGLCYTHYIASTTAIAIGLYHVVIVPKNRRNFFTLLSMIGVVLAFLPWGAYALSAVITERTLQRGLDIPTIAQNVLYTFGNGVWFILPLGCGMALIFGRGRGIRFVWFWAITLVGVALAFNQLTGFLFHVRHIIGLWVPCIVLMSAVLVGLYARWRWLSLMSATVWVVLGVYQTFSPAFMDSLPRQIPKLSREYIVSAQQWVTACAQPQDTLIFFTAPNDIAWENEIPLIYYFHGTPQRLAQVNTMIDLAQTNSQALNFAYDTLGDWQTRLKTLVAGADTLWYFARPDVAPITEETDFENAMHARYAYRTEFYRSDVLRVVAYSHIEGLTCAVQSR